MSETVTIHSAYIHTYISENVELSEELVTLSLAILYGYCESAKSLWVTNMKKAHVSC